MDDDGVDCFGGWVLGLMGLSVGSNFSLFMMN